MYLIGGDSTKRGGREGDLILEQADFCGLPTDVFQQSSFWLEEKHKITKKSNTVP
jgi:hypothetical protein